ncbi:protein fem-1 homolog C-like [Mytilus californianus]|uniref:protein fem-1 homolog C-like n=1 Tax=Mytilus californianus TaxID=6549 RepID=UPI0022483DB1|nr:protein fem-1 homolog C-like [Mytilus californianus]
MTEKKSFFRHFQEGAHKMSNLACTSVRTDDVDVPWYASIVHNCIQDDKLSKLKVTLRKFSKQQRTTIVNHKINGSAALFISSLKGRVHIVNYLLDDCGADKELKGIYEVELDHSRHEVSPLWCSAVANKLEVVKALVEHGADINSPSDTQSTPVRSACFMTNISIVKILVEHGANIHKPNINGGTCLINSVQSEELCVFLLSKGVDVNAKDNSGNLALHYAIREGRLDTVKVLLKYGSDHTAKNDFGDDALQTAALRGYKSIVKYILETTDQTRETSAHAYELLGANLVDEVHDIVGGLAMWQEAMNIRYQDENNPLIKKLPLDTNYAYLHAREPNNLKELHRIIDPDDVYMQALLIRERILGPCHKDVTFGLMYRGAVYADTHRYQRCVDLWKYTYILRHRKNDPLTHECLFTVQALVKLFWEMQVELESGTTEEKVKVADAQEVFEMLVAQIISGQESLKNSTGNNKGNEDFQLLLQLSLHVIHLMARLDKTSPQNFQFRKAVHHLILQDPRGQEGGSLLHLSVDPKISLTSEEFYSPFPTLSVVEILISCGIDINAVDSKRNTALHNSIKFLTYSELQNEGILDCLLQNDAHVDIHNAEGQSALILLQHAGLPVCPLQYQTLKCLAAESIMKHKISYEGEVPVCLLPFIQMHG